MAFARAGHPYEQLSRFSHPGSRTAFGCACLNPIRVNVENKYLARRLVIGRDKRVEGRPTLDVLAERLKANCTVTIAVGQNGRHTVTVPLLRGQIRLATGPCHLALRTGAPMLPVFTTRTGKNRFKVSVGAALEPGPRTSASERIEAMMCDYTARLGPVLRKWPQQFPWNRFDAG